ncbi:MAG TPA: PPOX class F420-dependent oxidoreductase [Tepidiformaceae bacterium]|nr:PPOX class F420-dependent oxidoreductase [Tepidiformaceae bacterium]
MIGSEEQDAFVRSMKACVVTTLRKDGSPATSVLFYAVDGDELLLSTTKDRLKAQTLRRDPRIVVTVLDEGAPYQYVSVEGTARLEDDDLVAAHTLINRAMRGAPEWAPPEGFEARLKGEGRVVIRVTPGRVSGVVRRG